MERDIGPTSPTPGVRIRLHRHTSASAETVSSPTVSNPHALVSRIATPEKRRTGYAPGGAGHIPDSEDDQLGQSFRRPIDEQDESNRAS